MPTPDEEIVPLPSAKPRWPRLRRLLRLGGMVLALGYVLQVGLLYTYQDAVLFPGASTRGRAPVEPRPDSELITVRTRTGDEIALLFAPALEPDGSRDSHAAKRPTLIYFYGNGTCLKTAAPQVERFRRLGANVLVAEYVGYGLSTGRPSEEGCYATADAAYDYLLTRKDVDLRRLVSAGGSLGGAVAIDLAARRPVAGLVTFMTFTCLCDVAQCKFPWIPAAPLLRSRFDSVTKIRRVDCPILLVHGTRDLMVPQSMQKQLASAATAPVTQVVVTSATHNDLFDVGEPQIADAVRQFLAEVKPVRRTD